jgi:hypothetical protein
MSLGAITFGPQLLVGIFLVSGLALLIATGRGWTGPRWTESWDVLGIERLFHRLAGGAGTYYRGLGWVFLAIGLLGVVRLLLGS